MFAGKNGEIILMININRIRGLDRKFMNKGFKLMHWVEVDLANVIFFLGSRKSP